MVRKPDAGVRPPLPNAPAGRVEVSSPVCYAAQADDVYMGYLDRDNLAAELNTLLEAERAGALVAARLVTDVESLDLKALARVIHRDEIRWCRMLIGALETLGVTPSTEVGDFYGKAMAIPDVVARFVFVNRGQAWVVRRLKALLPKVKADALHADLLAMLAAHDHNIARAESALDGRGGADLGTSAHSS